MSNTNRAGRLRALSSLFLVLLVAACASGETVALKPATPDESVLAPASAMLAKAQEAGAAEFAPRVLREARRRLTTARTMLYVAADDGGGVSDSEHKHIAQLVDIATLDARLALVRTQANAVASKLEEMRAAMHTPAAGEAEDTKP